MANSPVGPRIEPYYPIVHEREWGQEIFIAETPRYLGKVLKMHKGGRGGLQFHRRKDETFHLLSGKALVESDDGHGTLARRVMQPGESFHIPPGAPHRVTALEDCVFVEANTPHYDDRVRVEERYGEVAVGGLPTTG